MWRGARSPAKALWAPALTGEEGKVQAGEGERETTEKSLCGGARQGCLCRRVVVVGFILHGGTPGSRPPLLSLSPFLFFIYFSSCGGLGRVERRRLLRCDRFHWVAHLLSTLHCPSINSSGPQRKAVPWGHVLVRSSGDPGFPLGPAH